MNDFTPPPALDLQSTFEYQMGLQRGLEALRRSNPSIDLSAFTNPTPSQHFGPDPLMTAAEFARAMR